MSFCREYSCPSAEDRRAVFTYHALENVQSLNILVAQSLDKGSAGVDVFREQHPCIVSVNEPDRKSPSSLVLRSQSVRLLLVNQTGVVFALNTVSGIVLQISESPSNELSDTHRQKCILERQALALVAQHTSKDSRHT